MTQIKKSLDRVHLTSTQVKLIMPEKVFHEIKYLCKRIAKVEWSGILFYSIEGSIKDPANMVITLQDILPMHKGTASYTEYTLDERVIEYMMDNEESEDWKMGHIHSHNTMGVFFSGTDLGELDDNAPNHNFYLSLIVNNFMDFCARICFIIESSEAKFFDFYAKDENGAKYIYESKEYEVQEQKLISYDCDIHSPNKEEEVEDHFSKKVDGIIATAAIPVVPTYNYGKHATYQGSWKERQEKINKSWLPPTPNIEVEIERPPFTGFGSSIDDDDEPTLAQQIAESDDREDDIEKFCILILNTGNDSSEFIDIEDVLAFYKPFGISGKALAKNVLEIYAATYDKYFDKLQAKDNPQAFMEITREVIEELESETKYGLSYSSKEMLNPVIDALKVMIGKFATYNLTKK